MVLLALSLTLNLILAAITLFLLKQAEKKDRRNERVRQEYGLMQRDLLDRLMHVTGKTWTLPPKENLEEGEVLIDEETKRQLEGWRDI